jgi:hypothetical protein
LWTADQVVGQLDHGQVRSVGARKILVRMVIGGQLLRGGQRLW